MTPAIRPRTARTIALALLASIITACASPSVPPDDPPRTDAGATPDPAQEPEDETLRNVLRARPRER